MDALVYYMVMVTHCCDEEANVSAIEGLTEEVCERRWSSPQDSHSHSLSFDLFSS